MKKFIYFVQYHRTLFLLDKESNYHFLPCWAMQELGYDIEIVCYGKDLKIEDDPNFDPTFKVSYVNGMFESWYYIWKNRKNSVVYVNTFLFVSLLMGLFARKTIFFSHDPVFPNNFSKFYLIKKIFVKFAYMFFTKIRVINQYELDLLKKEGFENKGILLPLVISQKNFTEKISKENNILMLGHIFPKKGPETMLMALKIVIEKYPNIKIYQVGKNDEFISSNGFSFKDELKNLGIYDNFVLYGPRNNLKKLNLPTSIYINSSLQEGQCIAVYDAILLGNAVCLPNISSFKGDVLNNKFLSHNVGDYKKLAENIIFYIENSNKKEEFILEGRKYIAEKMNYEVIKNKMKENFDIL